MKEQIKGCKYQPIFQNTVDFCSMVTSTIEQTNKHAS